MKTEKLIKKINKLQKIYIESGETKYADTIHLLEKTMERLEYQSKKIKQLQKANQVSMFDDGQPFL